MSASFALGLGKSARAGAKRAGGALGQGPDPLARSVGGCLPRGRFSIAALWGGGVEPAAVFSGADVLLDHSRRIADDEAAGGDVAHDDRPCGDDAAVADLDPGKNDSAYANVAALADPGVDVLKMRRIMSKDVGS